MTADEREQVEERFRRASDRMHAAAKLIAQLNREFRDGAALYMRMQLRLSQEEGFTYQPVSPENAS